MSTNHELTWKEAFFMSPGPNGIAEFIVLIVKGLCMGVAHIIPGVSGGTIALITGIYIEFIDAIKSVNTDFIKKITSFKFKEALSVLHVRFLLAVFFGTLAAIVSLAQVASYLLSSQPVTTAAFFMGLIVASAFLVAKDIKHWLGTGGGGFIIGAIIAYLVVGLMPASTPDALWFVLIAGIISICAMILPGLSGAFILLVLGKYAYIVDAVKNPFITGNSLIILVFCIGCIIGLAAFSRLLSFFLKKYYNTTLAVLTGLMVGSLRKIWPWKEIIEAKLVQGKTIIISELNFFPTEITTETGVAIFYCICGFIIIILLEKISSDAKKKK